MKKLLLFNDTMGSSFDNKKYLESAISNLKEKVTNTKGKLYVEIGEELLKNNSTTTEIPGFDIDNKKKIVSEFRQDSEILVCINARNIIENEPLVENGLPCIDHIELMLKKISTATWIKPQIVITHVKIEEMYDLIFSFEKRFQKKGYKVRANYLKNSFPDDKKFLLSENWFGNDDHIPFSKKVIFVTSIGNKSGKLDTCVWQIYRDLWIGIESSFCLLQDTPITELEAKNQEVDQASPQKTFSIIKKLLSKEVEQDNLINLYNSEREMTICPERNKNS